MMPISPGAPLWMAARVILADRGDDLFQRWECVRITFGLEEIHDLRVSSRRLREGLALFSPCFPARNLRRIRSQVKVLTAILGTMRNTDEALLFFTPLPALVPERAADVVQQLIDQLQQERTIEQKSLKRRLKELDPTALRKVFVATCDQPRIFAAADNLCIAIADYLREKITKRELAVQELLPSARQEENITAQHRLRIAVKHLRYRCEMVAPLVGADLPPLLATLKQYQEMLGKMHDLDVFAGMIVKRDGGTGITEPVCTIIAERRQALFREFEKLLGHQPLATVSTRVRSLL